jgi:tRNA pseudouridine38-40 synthase
MVEIMRTLKITLAYDGTDFCGWQRQPEQRTVQGELEAALASITQEKLSVDASGRTDAGVHALGQVASVATANELSCETLQRGLNAELPDDVVVTGVEDVATDFHATLSAVRKMYRYVIDDGRAADLFRRHYTWRSYHRLDEVAMQRAASGLIGRHDFVSFQSAGSPRATTIRTIFDLRVTRHEHLIQIEVEGDGFLYNMVRAIAGTLVEVGRGARDASWPAEALAATDRSVAGPTAPPEGLFLVWVKY